MGVGRQLLRRIGLADAADMSTQSLVLLAFLIPMSLFLTADQNVLNPNLLLVQEEFDVSLYDLGAVSSAFTIVGAIVTLVWGYLTDKYSRRWLLAITVLLGEIPCFLTGFARTYDQLFLMRVLTGLGVGGVLPLEFSLIGDYFTTKERPTANAWIGTAMGLGMAFGQLMAGLVGPTYGWRLPFIVAAVPNFVLVPLFLMFSREPRRGEGEDELRALVRRGKEYTEKASLGAYKRLFQVPTNLLAFLQGLPGCIPWGILPFLIVTFYVQEKGFSIEQATVMSLVFGAGAIIGGLQGGIWGNALYNQNRAYLPLLNGVTTIIGTVPFFAVVLWPIPQNPGFGAIVFPSILAFAGGWLIGITSPNVKALLLNVNPPETRGSIFAVFNLTDSVGKGVGPILGGWLAVRYGLTSTMLFAVAWWVVCGLIWFPIARTSPRDEDKLRALMARRAEEMSRE
ncbi:MAG: MFS transporter [Firmicutes bacterium]|nr:MFS transporter [Bacillota bacterium]